MCFAPQRRALFRHLNLQKWREHVVFCTFWLQNVLRATTACTFSTSQLPKVVRQWCVLYILTWKCASRHNGVHFFDISTSKSGPTLRCLYILTSKCASRHNVHFFMSHLASRLRTRRFSEPTFRPSGATNHWKNTMFRGFPTFSRICIFFLLTLSLLIFSLLIFLFSLPLPCSAFHLSILSEVWLLNFLRINPINRTVRFLDVCEQKLVVQHMIGVSISDVLIHVQAIERLCDVEGGSVALAPLLLRPTGCAAGTSPWYSSWSSGISAPLSTCTRRSHSRPPLHARSVPLNGQSGRRQVGVLGFPHVARGYRQGVVRRNISPEACRDLVEARMLAERMERSFSEHCSQVLFRIPPVLLLQPQMYWAPCTCVAAVGTWTRWPPAGALGPHTPFRAHPVPFRSCWCWPRAGQGVQGVVRYNILAPCPVPRRPGSVHDLFGVAIKTSSFGRWPGTSSEAQTPWACASRTTLRPWHAWAA